MSEISFVHMCSSHILEGEFSANESTMPYVQEMKRVFADLYVTLLCKVLKLMPTVSAKTVNKTENAANFVDS